MGTMATHHPVRAVEEDRVDLTLQANLARVLIVFFLNFED
jgi:hypothetical protein